MTALLLVDLQNDFLPTGSLPVPDGDAVIPVANELQTRFELVVASQDWHPPDHGSFASQHPGKKPGDEIELDGLKQILWPDHCVEGTTGAEFPRDLATDRFAQIIRKGTERSIDSYSAFFDNGHRKATGLHEYLQARDVRRVFVVGLALDVCVKFTVLDARQLGYETILVRDGTRGVDLQPGDCERALQQMREAGARLVESSEVGALLAAESPSQ